MGEEHAKIRKRGKGGPSHSFPNKLHNGLYKEFWSSVMIYLVLTLLMKNVLIIDKPNFLTLIWWFCSKSNRNNSQILLDRQVEKRHHCLRKPREELQIQRYYHGNHYHHRCSCDFYYGRICHHMLLLRFTVN